MPFHLPFGNRSIQIDPLPEISVSRCEDTFARFLRPLAPGAAGQPLLHVRHTYSDTDALIARLEQPFYDDAPWRIYHQQGSCYYINNNFDYHPRSVLGIMERRSDGHELIWHVHPDNRVYYRDRFRLRGITGLGYDQVFLVSLLPSIRAFLLHSSGCILDGKGLAFVGASGAGKSTTAQMLSHELAILSDDRNLVRFEGGQPMLEATWIHGSFGDIHPGSAPLHRVYFLEKSDTFFIRPVEAIMDRLQLLFPRVVRGLVPAGWWDRTLDLVTKLIHMPLFFRLGFSPHDSMVERLREHVAGVD
ncbi:hypothetical protein GF324_13660 [bacterium]|nr:hypothetical protein [bacterium]